MKKYLNIIGLLLSSFILYSCCFIQLNADEKYQPLGQVVSTANGLLLAKDPHERPKYFQENEYKGLLKGNYETSYNTLLPFSVKLDPVSPNSNDFIVSIFDNKKLILIDWSCTERYIDCWIYNKECNPDTLKVECDKSPFK